MMDIDDGIKSWKCKLKKACELNNDNYCELSSTLSREEITKKFALGYGGSKGKLFTAWSANYVYFPAEYDGYEWVESVHRNPSDIAIQHIEEE